MLKFLSRDYCGECPPYAKLNTVLFNYVRLLIGGASNLTGEQLKTLIDDAKTKPDITNLVSSIDTPIFLRQLMVDFSALVLMKTDWHDSEVDTLKRAVSSTKMPDENRSKLWEALELLRSISRTIPTE